MQKAEETVGKVFEVFVKQHFAKLRTGGYVEQTMRRVLTAW